MTRKELVRHILKTYGQKATANGKEAWAVIRPLRKQSDEAPQCYLYTGTPDQKLLTGDLVQVGTEWYRVTRADVEWLEGESLYVWAVLRREEETAFCTEEEAWTRTIIWIGRTGSRRNWSAMCGAIRRS